MISFDWDIRKALLNVRKHGISFEEARSVFYDEDAIQFFDEVPAVNEDRFIMLGLSSMLRILIVVHCVRNDGATIRIISARKATARERMHYKGGRK